MSEKARFKPGDTVVIRHDLKPHTMYGRYGVVPNMYDMRGQTAVIKRVHESPDFGISYALEGKNYAWTDGMLEKAAVKRSVSIEERKTISENASRFFDILREAADE